MHTMRSLSDAQMKLIQEHVETGERICWVGCEPHSRYYRRRLLRIAMLILWIAVIGSFAAIMVLMNPLFLKKSFAYSLPILTPICLAALGGYLLARELIRTHGSGPDLYAVTNRRALFITQDREHKACAYGPEILKSLQVRRQQDGSGDIIFERVMEWTTDESGRSTHLAKQVGFFGLPFVDEAYQKLQQIGQPDTYTRTARYS